MNEAHQDMESHSDTETKNLLQEMDDLKTEEQRELEEDLKKVRDEEQRRILQLPEDEQITELIAWNQRTEARLQKVQQQLSALELQMRLQERDRLELAKSGDQPNEGIKGPTPSELDHPENPSESAFQRIYNREDGESIKPEIGEGKKPALGAQAEGETEPSQHLDREEGRPGGPEGG